MNDINLIEVAEHVRKKLSQCENSDEEQARNGLERDIGEELFQRIFQKDTTIIGPWHLRSSGRQKEEKYANFKDKWEALCAEDTLGARSRDLSVWCRSAAVAQMLRERGMDTGGLSWADLKRLQGIRSVRKIFEQCLQKLESTENVPSSQRTAKPSHSEPQVQVNDAVPLMVDWPSQPKTQIDGHDNPECEEIESTPCIQTKEPFPMVSVELKGGPGPSLEATIHAESNPKLYDDILNFVDALMTDPDIMDLSPSLLIKATKPASFALLPEAERSALIDRLARVKRKYLGLCDTLSHIESAVSWSRRLAGKREL